MSFDEIVLSRLECKTLKEIENSPIGVSTSVHDAINRLKYYDFVEILVYTGPEAFPHLTTFPMKAVITERGKSYLTYLRGQRTRRWKDRAYGFVTGVLTSTLAQLIVRLIVG